MAQHLHSSCRTLHATAWSRRHRKFVAANAEPALPCPATPLFWPVPLACLTRLTNSLAIIYRSAELWERRRLDSNYLTATATATAVWHMNKWMYEWMNECVCEWCEQTAWLSDCPAIRLSGCHIMCLPQRVIHFLGNLIMKFGWILFLRWPRLIISAEYAFVSVSVSIYVPSVSWVENCNFSVSIFLAICFFRTHLAVINIYAKFICICF